jgi:hypothetical protein
LSLGRQNKNKKMNHFLIMFPLFICVALFDAEHKLPFCASPAQYDVILLNCINDIA